MTYTVPLREQVRKALIAYFENLNGHQVHNLYDLVLQEVEQPLLIEVMKYTKNNQSSAASLLGVNRGTLRKKLKQYELD